MCQQSPGEVPDEPICPRCARQLHYHPSRCCRSCNVSVTRCTPCVQDRRSGCYSIKDKSVHKRIMVALGKMRDLEHSLLPIGIRKGDVPKELKDEAYAISKLVDKNYVDSATLTSATLKLPGSASTVTPAKKKKRKRDLDVETLSNDVANELAVINTNLRALIDTQRVFVDAFCSAEQVKRKRYYDESSGESEDSSSEDDDEESADGSNQLTEE